MKTKKERSIRAAKAAAVVLVDTLAILSMCLTFFIVQTFKFNKRRSKNSADQD